MRRRFMLPLVPLVLCAGYTGYWFIGAGVVRGEVERWIEVQQRDGTTVDVQELSVVGFPLRFDAVLDSYSMTRPDGMVVTGRDLKVGAPAWDWSLIGFEVAEEQSVALPSLPPLTLRSDDGEGEFRVEGGRPQSGAATVRNLVLEAPSGPPLTVAQVDYQQTQQLERDGVVDDSYGGLDVSIRGVVLPAELLPGLGMQIDEATVATEISQPWPPSLRAPLLSRWRDDGGEVRVRTLTLTWGPLEIAASGVLTLDEDLQPRGDLDAQVRGMNALAQALSADGDGQSAGLLGLGVGLFGGGGDDGSVTLPLTVQNGQVRLGPIPLMELPQIDWPA